MNDGADRDVALFTEAVQLPTGERAAYLERACANDSARLRRVEDLLRAHGNIGDFLEKSPDGAAMVSKQGTASWEKPAAGKSLNF